MKLDKKKHLIVTQKGRYFPKHIPKYKGHCRQNNKIILLVQTELNGFEGILSVSVFCQFEQKQVFSPELYFCKLLLDS